LVAFGNTDEIFAVSVSRGALVGYKYMYGLILTPVLGWTMGTLFGAAAGNILPAVVTTSLGVAIYGMFVAIVMPQAKEDKAAALCVFISIILSCAFKYLPVLNTVPSGFVIIICAVVASVIMALVAPIKIETEEVETNAVH
jgi:predicted branched-subunit amino acid permease